MNEQDKTNLRQQTKSLAAKEKHFTALLLKNLAVIEREKLYSDYRYPSLHKYLTVELKYSAAEAATRVAAVRLILRKKEVVQKIKAGELSLTNAAQTENAIKQHEREKKKNASAEEVSRAIGLSENESSRHAKEELRREFNLKTPRTETWFLSEYILKQVDRAREIYGDVSSLELFEIFLQEKLRAPGMPLTPLKVMKKEKRQQKKQGKQEGIEVMKQKEMIFGKKGENKEREKCPEVLKRPNQSPTKPPAKAAPRNLRKFRNASSPSPQHTQHNTRHISAQVKATQYASASGKCENCGERRNLEYDHKQEFALGGDGSAKNIQILCRNCNQRKRIKVFGHREFS